MATDNLMPQSSTSIIKHFMLRSSTTGQGLTGKVYSDFGGKYNIAGGAEVTLSFSSGSVGDAYSSGKIVPLGLGKYAWHVPNAVFASLGNVSAVLTVTGGIDVHCEWLVVADNRTLATKPVNVTQFGGTNGTFNSGVPTAELDSGITDQFDAIETAVDAGNNYHVTTLARLGSWAGTGVNTILGAFRAIAAKLPGITPTDISSGTSYNNAAHSLESAATIANTAIAPAPLERNPTDTGVITFAWPVSGATITGTVSIDNSEYVAVAGNIAFLREDSGRYYYTLSYDAADRPAAAGSARYTLTDGEYTRYVILRVVESGDTGEATAMAVLKLDWQTITGEVPSRSVLNALRHIRNKWALDGHTKTVYAEDDATPAYTTTVTADGAGNITADTPN